MSQREYEMKYLENIISIIKEKIKLLSEKKILIKKNMDESNKQFNNDTSWIVDFEEGNAVDSSQGLLNLKSSTDEIKRIDEAIIKYNVLLNKPYFGKIILDNKEDIYIGNSTLKTSEENILIYDWRTPIASIFYENKLGEVTYKVNFDSSFTVDVTSRTQFIIEGGELIKMINSDSYIGDPELIEIITEKSSNKIANVVSTIQSEQNKVIRQPASQNTLVYGPPGSGKTTIAIQRIAYLLYRYRNNLSNEDLMLFLPNELFNDYISDALPELGENNVKYNNFNNFTKKLFYFNNKTKESFIECVQRVNKDNKNFVSYDKKTRLEFYNLIIRGIEELSIRGLKFKDFQYHGEIVISKEVLERKFYSEYKNVDIKKRVSMIREYLIKIYNVEVKKLFKLKYKELYNMNTYVGEKHELVEQAKEYSKLKLKPLRILIKSHRFIDIYSTYLNFLDKSDYNYEVNIKNKILFEDLPPLILILLHLVNLKDNSIKHIIIDEIQDYSNIQLNIMKKYFPKATFTLLGDSNQTLFPRPLTKINEEEFVVLKLNNSYRSTEQINKYLEELIPSNLISIGREGNEVTIVNSKNIYESLINILKKVENKVAIITPDKETLSLIKEFNFDGFKVIKDEDTLYHNKNIVIPYYLAKGFEYNTVISIGHNKYTNKHIKYIIGSRAIKKLYLLNVID